MKFLIDKFTVDKAVWLETQNNSFKRLEENKPKDQKIDRPTILATASLYLMQVEKDKLLEKLNKENPDKIFFMGVEQNVQMSPDNLSYDLKSYYFDDLDQFKLDIDPEHKFFIPADSEKKVEEFLKNFISEYSFRVPVIKDKVEQGDLVSIEIYDMEDNMQGTYFLEGKNVNEANLLKFLENKNLTDKHQTVLNEQDVKIKVASIYQFKKMPITDENIHLLQMENVKTLEDVKEFIRFQTFQQIVIDQLFNYGQEIMLQINRENLAKIDFQPDLLASESDPVKFAAYNIKGDYKQIALETITNYFWTMLFIKKLQIIVSRDDIEIEFNRFRQVLGQEAYSIPLFKIANTVLYKKLGLYYLQKLQPEDFAKYSKYFSK
ncbi:trigger factor-related chaperone [Mycoplasma nasistruthionis]|uniref:Uncharacterized protein n=1 Tax=Mycoplasma nasistruthionis TaxID=353852 RepID=A0A4Y6I6S3_9MOLU|nr:hypothetical protein [Mycoplasma nasistruthionis]QCZ36951.1 hypothetical protein FG904_02995 [Mycoplasma nasistruthionis]QDF65223.1 hypothetical protein FIV53_02940 [Mycoplasma nasistruthionis]